MAETRCPNPRCRTVFPVPDEALGRNAPCPNCGQVITARPLSVLLALDRQKARIEKVTKAGAPAGDPPFSALLDDVRSLWNVGSIFRTADGAGVGKLHLCGITGCPPRKEIAKTSLGAEEVVPFEYHVHPLDAILPLKERGVRIVVLEHLPRSVPLRDAAPAAPLCLAVGNEVVGVSAEVVACADAVVHLPMRGAKQSLNVAVAFGIAAYEIAERLAGR